MLIILSGKGTLTSIISSGTNISCPFEQPTLNPASSKFHTLLLLILSSLRTFLYALNHSWISPASWAVYRTAAIGLVVIKWRSLSFHHFWNHDFDGGARPLSIRNPQIAEKSLPQVGRIWCSNRSLINVWRA